jgi:hypothetical protein
MHPQLIPQDRQEEEDHQALQDMDHRAPQETNPHDEDKPIGRVHVITPSPEETQETITSLLTHSAPTLTKSALNSKSN